jgi:hypothetical protein
MGYYYRKKNYSPQPLTGTLTDLKKVFQLEEVFQLEITPIILQLEVVDCNKK